MQGWRRRRGGLGAAMAVTVIAAWRYIRSEPCQFCVKLATSPYVWGLVSGALLGWVWR